MPAAPQTSLHFEVVESVDAQNWQCTTITCHGRLVSDTAAPLKELVQPLIEQGGHIVIDCADLAHVDSYGLGALVALKVSAIHRSYSTLDLDNITPRLLELLILTHLNYLFSH